MKKRSGSVVAHGAVKSIISMPSLTGANTYNLSNVESMTANQEYAEIDYSAQNVPAELDEYTILTNDLAMDDEFINGIIAQILSELKLMNYDKTDILIENVKFFLPSFIRMCDYSKILQSGKTIEEYKSAIYSEIIKFILENKDLMSDCDLNNENQIVVANVSLSILMDLSHGQTIEEILRKNDLSINIKENYCKRVFEKFISKYCVYNDEETKKSAKYFNSAFSSAVGSSVTNTTPVFASLFVNVFKGSILELFPTESLVKMGLKSLIKKRLVTRVVENAAAGVVPAAGTRVVPFVSSNLLSNVSKTGFKVQGRFVNDVKSFLSGDSIFKKLFLPKNVTTVKEFADELAKNTCLKGVACKAVGTGVTTLVVGSIVSGAFEFGETFAETGDIGQSLAAAGKQMLEDLPRNTSVAVGAAVGQFGGSLAGAAIGGFFGGPVGAYIGEKVGGMLGSMLGGLAGSFLYDVFTDPEPAWYKPWTWF